jgi:hypothetical protein
MGTQAHTTFQSKVSVSVETICYYAKGVGLVVVERPVVLAALEAAEVRQVAVAGPVVLAALPAVYYQRGYTAQLAVAHPHQTTIHLPEGCLTHSGTHARFVCGQDFCCLGIVET